MEFEDPVYGNVTVSSDVLQQLIQTAPVQRLKQINQAGPQHYFMDKPEVTRFQHSVGVMTLLNRFDAPIEEQIAGLLHDVPHTAFSHAIDFVYDTDDHEYHERFLEQVVYDSQIPEIVTAHGLDMDYILDETHFGLLERDLPDLCADRIDYFLRDMTVGARQDITHFLDHLTVYDGRFVVADINVAEAYALEYIHADEEMWANPKEVAVFELFARAMRQALETGVLTQQDLFGTDQEVYATLQDADDPQIQQPLERLANGFDVELDPDNYDFRVSTKARYVNPLVVTDNGAFRIAEQSEQVRERIKEHKSFVNGGYPIKIID